jgi:hypothetical protein
MQVRHPYTQRMRGFARAPPAPGASDPVGVCGRRPAGGVKRQRDLVGCASAIRTEALLRVRDPLAIISKERDSFNNRRVGGECEDCTYICGIVLSI